MCLELKRSPELNSLPCIWVHHIGKSSYQRWFLCFLCTEHIYQQSERYVTWRSVLDQGLLCTWVQTNEAWYTLWFPVVPSGWRFVHPLNGVTEEKKRPQLSGFYQWISISAFSKTYGFFSNNNLAALKINNLSPLEERAKREQRKWRHWKQRVSNESYRRSMLW